jgi:hypothetical protein
MQEKINANLLAIGRLQALKPNAYLTYCNPVGDGDYGWIAHEYGVRLSGFHDTVLGAVQEAIDNISKQ